MDGLRSGECVIQCAGGTCTVCKERVAAGKAVQLSKYTSRIRHLTCMPATDRRYRRIGPTRSSQYTSRTPKLSARVI